MKTKTLTIIFISIMFLETLLLIRNITLYNPQVHVVVKVISKFDSPHVIKHKHNSEISGIDNMLRVYSKEYGYGDIMVTTNTWMEAEVDKYIPFALSYHKMNEVFGTDMHQPLMEQISVVLLLILLTIMAYCIMRLIYG